ncbi:MAG TPA: aldehyde dehydrogenase family protein, partial [Acidimicrobiales bacterium]|nr:aldehyde dehydrogenase family protein [Acidimicrobiales bacterium]
MSVQDELRLLANPDHFFIGGEWVAPSSDSAFEVIDSATEQVFMRVAEAQAPDMDRAINAARTAFDEGPWPRMTHAERASYLEALGAGIAARNDDLGQIWPRQSGALHKVAQYAGLGAQSTFNYYAGLANTFAWEERATPSAGGKFGLLVREPVGVVGAIIPWNAPLGLIANKVAPALIAGCTVVLKASPEAPGEAYVVAEAAEAIGLPPGVLNVLTADREVSELLVRDPRVDKITFTGSTAAGRRIASICGERIARCTLELGGKSAAVILDDMDLGV